MKKIRLKDCFVNRSKNLSDNFVGNILYIDIGNVSYEKGIINKLLIDFKDAPSRARKVVKNNDIIISTVRTYLKSIVKISNPEPNLIVSTGFAVLKPKLNFYPKFLEYSLKNDMVQYIISQKSKGVSYPSINSDELLSIVIDCPSLNEQITIASYLDTETSKIDRKISILEQKYENLEEYKQSVIFETVTKGLDSSVPMKNSGIEWIGAIPSHWEVKRVKEVAKWQTGFTPDTKKSEYYDGNDGWITIGDMNGKYIEESKNKINGSLFPKGWITPANSLLFSFKLSIGQVAFNEKAVFTNEAICSFSPKSKINLKYFYYAAPVFIVKNAKKNIYGADLLNQELISNAFIVNLPNKEQELIANYLDAFTSKVDKKKEIIKKQIELLKEYKQSVIYEAVTGKIELGE